MAAFSLLAGCAAQAAARPVVSASVVQALSVPDPSGYARAIEPWPFEFPRDHGPHPEFRTEWWYYTGNLDGPNGEQFGYQLTFFRSALTPEEIARDSSLASNQVYMAHFAISDAQAETHWSFDRYSRGAAGLAGATGEPAFSVWLEDWRAEEIAPDVVRLQASAAHEDGPVALDLTLRETRPVVFHGFDGLHQKGPEEGNASYYYSLVGLESSGSVTTPSGTVAVTGQSWMDHEFGTSALSEDALGWDWFSLQMDNGAAIMLYGFRTSSGNPVEIIKATVAWPDGRQQRLSAADFTTAPTREWTSPTTGITYPVAWDITIPDLETELAVETLFDDQEMDVQFVYYEGAISAAGSMLGADVSGRGYVELTGYGQEAGEYQR
ncbi:MAG: lipocalin-like domain-containing protein [Caldilineaceae bacterium]